MRTTTLFLAIELRADASESRIREAAFADLARQLALNRRVPLATTEDRQPIYVIDTHMSETDLQLDNERLQRVIDAQAAALADLQDAKAWHPLDHNGECVFCDEHAAEIADHHHLCPWRIVAERMEKR